MNNHRNSTAAFGAAILLVVTAATAQVVVQPGAASPGADAIDNSGNYQSEVQACKQGRSAEDEATCLKEARNARADKQRGALANGADYRANAMARCNALSGEDKTACEARMLGYGSVSGSVAGGGVLREVETVQMPPGQDSVTVVPKT
ncbi:hypothetical protein IM725_16220, partial [Ramlibacter aquaticus]